MAQKTVLIVSQTFVPDPAAVGQHVADVAFELARRGHLVRVYASGRGYEDPSKIYPKREVLHGVDVRRFPLASFGKKSILLRILGTAVFHLQAFFAALFTPRLAGIFFSTSPPLIGLPICIVALLRRVPAIYWAMDLNPDQLIALGKLKQKSVIARILELINRFILRRATLVIALDRFMSQRLIARGIPAHKILILPPWSPDDLIHDQQSENPFRQRHGLLDKFVIMYSGNHSPSNPLKTLLDAAIKLKDEPNLKFLFVGGGSGKKEVEAAIRDHNLAHTLSLPYQPLSELKYSLTAADVHVVSLGDKMVGIIHPCKIYGAMTAGKPILFFGPRPSHISDLLDEHAIGFQISHGDSNRAIETINRLRHMPPEELSAIGRQARQLREHSLSQQQLCRQLCDAVENTLHLLDRTSS